MDWTAGYVADVAYTAGYFPELNPLRIPLALLNAGYAPPNIQNACELGFGQGVSIAMHAAGQPSVKWFGDDFNPSHAAYARWLADSAGVQADLTDESFADFCSRDDLPDFDYIALHGIWSWISDENRAIIVDFLQRKLKVGGVAYISYNTLPGWAAAMPLRDLMARHGDLMGAKGQSSFTKLDAAMAFGDKLFALQPAYLRANEGISARFEALKNQHKAYVAHEYLNRDWKPMYFTEIAAELRSAKLDFACSANLGDAVEEAHLTTEQRAFLAGIENDDFREMIRDYIGNVQFRRDYWVKGGRQLADAERIARIRDVRLVLVTPPDRVAKNINTALGEIALQPAVYDPIINLLSDFKPHSVGEIEQKVAPDVVFIQVLQAVMLLGGMNTIAVAQSDKEIAAARPAVRKLNAAIMEQSLYSDGLAYLASPVTGGAVSASRFDQMLHLGVRAGVADYGAAADGLWDQLKAQGQRLVKEGRTLQTDEENLQEFRSFAKDFAHRAPTLAALGVTDAPAPQSGHKRR